MSGLVAVALGLAACGASAPEGSGSTASKPLSAPTTSVTQESSFLEDVAEADPSLSSYVQRYNETAMKALLTDGDAFCGFLLRGGGIDDALTSLAVGAQSVESQTHLPMNVTTFNTVEGVALVTLCPTEQRLIPSADQAKIRALGAQLTSG